MTPDQIRQTLVTGSTPRVVAPADLAEFLATDPAWDFAGNPVRAVSHCADQAAWAHERGGTHERYWVSVAKLLVARADNPHVQLGAVLEGIASGPPPI